MDGDVDDDEHLAKEEDGVLDEDVVDVAIALPIIVLSSFVPGSPLKNVRMVLAPLGIDMPQHVDDGHEYPGLHLTSAGAKSPLRVRMSSNSGMSGRPAPPRGWRPAACRSGLWRR